MREIGKKQLSYSAQLKLEWIIFYHTLGEQNATKTALHFGMTRKTLHKWLSRFDERNLKTLVEQSRAPKKKRGWAVTREEEANKDLTKWLVKYNDYRPHEVPDYLTPLEYAQKHLFKVSPMWSASTINCYIVSVKV